MASTPEHQILCPSSKCQDGAILLGIVQRDGHISFASRKIVIDEEFVQIAHQGRSPEKRFRFSDKCVKNSCKQWTGTRCGIIDKVIEIMETTEPPSELPNCSIREECRWYKQCGGKACAVCPEIITDLT